MVIPIPFLVSYPTLIFCGATNATQVAVKSIAWYMETASIDTHMAGSAAPLMPHIAVMKLEMLIVP